MAIPVDFVRFLCGLYGWFHHLLSDFQVHGRRFA